MNIYFNLFSRQNGPQVRWPKARNQMPGAMSYFFEAHKAPGYCDNACSRQSIAFSRSSLLST
jgi:hypothetical protein